MSMRHVRWWGLFVALLLQMILNPCMRSELSPHTWFYILLNSLVVIGILGRLSSHWLHLTVGLILSLPILAIYWLPFVPYSQTVLLSFTGLLYLYAVAVSFSVLLKAQQIGIAELTGACSLYLLVGLAWAILYSLLALQSSGAFLPDQLTLADFTYYSFVTLTTLGYGDIVPVSCEARSLATLEAVSGLFCLSIVVARLIGIHAASVLKQGDSDA